MPIILFALLLFVLLAFGGVVLLSLALRYRATRWESQPEGLFYTPSRWLALLVMLAIAARLVYGWWQTTHRSAAGEQHWLLSASGTQISLAVAAWLIGYYLIYAIGVRLRIARHDRERAN